MVSANAVSVNVAFANAATFVYAATFAIFGSSALGSTKQCKQVWSPPDAFVFKVNVDEVVFAEQRKLGVGVVIRNCEGLFMGALSMKLNQHLEVEAKTYELGIMFAKIWDFMRLFLRGILLWFQIAGISPPPS